MGNSTITCTRRLTFAAGHRVFGHEGKCRHLHGHNYAVEVTARAPRLDRIGRVVDFGVLKERFSAALEEWDHGFLVFEKDTAALAALGQIEGQKIISLPFNPTAENLASAILDQAPALLFGTEVVLVRVVVHETENCRAEANLA